MRKGGNERNASSRVIGGCASLPPESSLVDAACWEKKYKRRSFRRVGIVSFFFLLYQFPLYSANTNFLASSQEHIVRNISTSSLVFRINTQDIHIHTHTPRTKTPQSHTTHFLISLPCLVPTHFTVPPSLDTRPSKLGPPHCRSIHTSSTTPSTQWPPTLRSTTPAASPSLPRIRILHTHTPMDTMSHHTVSRHQRRQTRPSCRLEAAHTRTAAAARLASLRHAQLLVVPPTTTAVATAPHPLAASISTSTCKIDSQMPSTLSH